MPCPGVKVAHKYNLSMGECITDTVLQLLPNGASCHADAVALQWWYVAYNQVQVLIKPSLPADFQYSEGVGRVTGYVCDVTEELVPEVAGQPATCLPPQQRMRPNVLQRPEARNVRRLLPLAQPGLREHQYISPNSRLRQLTNTT